MSTKEFNREQRHNSLVGRKVAFQVGQTLQGVVVEERGPIGHNREYLLTVHVAADPYEPLTFELQESLVSLVEEDNPLLAIEPAEAIDYLQHGGLISLLRANLGGGRDQPRAWLRRDSRGNVTHTFIERDDGLGGAPIPFAALHEEQVFRPEKDKVVQYLKSFGLSAAQAGQIINKVGLFPS